jgi:hypothetical protein
MYSKLAFFFWITLTSFGYSQINTLDTIKYDFNDNLQANLYILKDKPYEAPSFYMGATLNSSLDIRSFVSRVNAYGLLRIQDISNIGIEKSITTLFSGPTQKSADYTHIIADYTLFDELSSNSYTLHLGFAKSPEEKGSQLNSNNLGKNYFPYESKRIVNYEAYERSQLNFQGGFLADQHLIQVHCSDCNNNQTIAQYSALTIGLDYMVNTNLEWKSSLDYHGYYQTFERSQLQFIFKLDSKRAIVYDYDYYFNYSDSLRASPVIYNKTFTPFGVRYISESLKKNSDNPIWIGSRWQIGFMPTLRGDSFYETLFNSFQISYDLLLQFGF